MALQLPTSSRWLTSHNAGPLNKIGEPGETAPYDGCSRWRI